MSVGQNIHESGLGMFANSKGPVVFFRNEPIEINSTSYNTEGMIGTGGIFWQRVRG